MRLNKLFSALRVIIQFIVISHKIKILRILTLLYLSEPSTLTAAVTAAVCDKTDDRGDKTGADIWWNMRTGAENFVI